MMRSLLIPGLLMMAVTPTLAAAQAPAAAAAAATYSVEETDVGTLLDNPAAKAILDKHMPGFSSKDQIDMARSMTLRTVQQYAPDMITDKVLGEIQADLNKLPAAK